LNSRASRSCLRKASPDLTALPDASTIPLPPYVFALSCPPLMVHRGMTSCLFHARTDGKSHQHTLSSCCSQMRTPY
jgi:hypothetical protein